MKFSEIEEKILLWIGVPIVIVGFLLSIYVQGWTFWKNWLWDLGSMLLGIALICGLVCMVIFSLLYFGERKKREQLEQEVRKLQNQIERK